MMEEVTKGRYKAHPLGLMCSSTSPAADAIVNLYEPFRIKDNHFSS